MRPLIAALTAAVVLATLSATASAASLRRIDAPSVQPAAMAPSAESPEEKYCHDSGGLVEIRVPTYGTNTARPLTLAGTAPFCNYAAKDGSHIWVLLSTLYTTEPTLAALAYDAKVKESATCANDGGANPASCYCTQLGGTDQFGGTNLAGGAWVLPRGGTYAALEACIFPDLSSIDSFGLFYHSAGIVRGRNLETVLRYRKP